MRGNFYLYFLFFHFAQSSTSMLPIVSSRFTSIVQEDDGNCDTIRQLETVEESTECDEVFMNGHINTLEESKNKSNTEQTVEFFV